MAILAYIFFFVPLLAGTFRKSEFVRFHTNQGTVLAIFSIGYSIVYGIISSILGVIFAINAGLWVIGTIIIGVLGLLWLLPLALCILGIVNAATGKCNPLPVIGKITIVKPVQ